MLSGMWGAVLTCRRRHPKEFVCEITPRSEKAEALVRAVDDASA